MVAVDALVPILVVCLLALVAGAAALAFAAPRRARLVSRADAEELDAVGRRLLAERHDDVAVQLRSALETLRRRRVPLGRVVRAGGIRGQAVLEFADGTRIVTRAVGRVDLGAVAVAALRRRVLVQSWSDDGTRLAIELAWTGGRRRVEAVAVEVSD